jgi:hypothetical protein
MNVQGIFKCLLASGWLALLTPAWAATNTPSHIYPCGMGTAIKVGNDLYATLDPAFQKIINPEAVATQQLAAPVLAPIPGNHQGLLCQVSVSTGFVDLLNHIAHAKAIDRIQPGFFMQNAVVLAQEGADGNPAALPNLDKDRYWTDAVMKDQASFFNEMIAITLAMNLSHHYLGHFGKYAAQMPDGKPEPINNLIAPAEWEASVKYAALNSLDCAISTEGAKALFEFIEQMPRRPAWAGYIVPQGANIEKINAQLSRYEHDYFRGGIKMDKAPPALSVASIPNRANHGVGNK